MQSTALPEADAFGKKITAYQIKMLHALSGALELTKDEYRLRIQQMHGFSGSCLDLSSSEADALIASWRAEAIEKGVWKDYRRQGGKAGLKYEDLGKRDKMASPKQLRKIEAMWKDVSRYRIAAQEINRAAALKKFIKRIVGVEDMRFVEQWHARVLIKAMDSMKEAMDETKRRKALR